MRKFNLCVAELRAQELLRKLTTVLHFREKILIRQGIARVETVQSVTSNLQIKVLKSIFHFSAHFPTPVWFRLHRTPPPAKLAASMFFSSRHFNHLEGPRQP